MAEIAAFLGGAIARRYWIGIQARVGQGRVGDWKLNFSWLAAILD